MFSRKNSIKTLRNKSILQHNKHDEIDDEDNDNFQLTCPNDTYKENLKSLKRTISLPISRSQRNHQTGVTKKEIKKLKFYDVIKDWEPDTSELPISKANQSYLKISVKELVQLISIEKNGFCLVRSISSIGTGLVPFDCLHENLELSKSLGLPPIFTMNKPSINSTPPTSPMTIISKNFSIASVSRSKTISANNTKNRSNTDKIDDTYRDHVNTFLSTIEFCQLVDIESRENRLIYHLVVKNSSTKKKYCSERYYESFYRLQSKIAELAPPSLKIPWLPIPFSCTNNMKPNSYLDSDRLTTFNTYLKEIVDTITECSSPVLRQLLYVWLTKNSIELLDYRLMMIKICHNNQYFAINCKDNEIAILKDLKRIIKERIPNIPLTEDNKIKANLDGWYIVELSNEDIYQQAFIKGWQTKFLNLEIE